MQASELPDPGEFKFEPIPNPGNESEGLGSGEDPTGVGREAGQVSDEMKREQWLKMIGKTLNTQHPAMAVVEEACSQPLNV